MSLAARLIEAVERVESARSHDPRMYRVWRFDDAPANLRALSTHGGDEDWLAVVPPDAHDRWPLWADEGPFGPCSVSRHDLPDGSVVVIGAHA